MNLKEQKKIKEYLIETLGEKFINKITLGQYGILVKLGITSRFENIGIKK